MNIQKVISLNIIMLILIFFAGCTDNLPTVLYVDDSFDSSIAGWNYDHFKTIQKAIDSATDDCTIFVNDGVYSELIDITKNVTLIGSDPNSTVLLGDAENNIITVQLNGLLNITGFTIRFAGESSMNSFEPAGISLYSGDNIVFGNLFLNNTCGIYSEYYKNNIIENNKFQDNFYGISLYTNSENNIIKNNLFINNQIGLRIKSSNNNTAFNNIFEENVGGAYLCCGSIDNLFHSNIFINNEEFNAQDWSLNIWNSSTKGNYWENFHEPYQGAFDENNDGIIDAPYNISRGYKPKEYPNKDFLPLVNKPVISNQFYSKN